MKFAALSAAFATVVVAAGSTHAQSNLGMTWMVMILGVAGVGALVRGGRANGASRLDV